MISFRFMILLLLKKKILIGFKKHEILQKKIKHCKKSQNYTVVIKIDFETN